MPWAEPKHKNKRQSDRLDKKQEPTIYFLQETHFRAKDTQRLKVKGWKKIFHANRNEKWVSQYSYQTK